jgi:hypothetical protein
MAAPPTVQVQRYRFTTGASVAPQIFAPTEVLSTGIVIVALTADISGGTGPSVTDLQLQWVFTSISIGYAIPAGATDILTPAARIFVPASDEFQLQVLLTSGAVGPLVAGFDYYQRGPTV